MAADAAGPLLGGAAGGRLGEHGRFGHVDGTNDQIALGRMQVGRPAGRGARADRAGPRQSVLPPQVLPAAEAAGIRGTGIGCYFDDPVHDVFGSRGPQHQSMYHFTMGGPVEDSRLITMPDRG